MFHAKHFGTLRVLSRSGGDGAKHWVRDLRNEILASMRKALTRASGSGPFGTLKDISIRNSQTRLLAPRSNAPLAFQRNSDR